MEFRFSLHLDDLIKLNLIIYFSPLQEIFFCSGISRGLDLIVVWCGLHGDVVYGRCDYERKRQGGLLGGPGRQLH